jgi:hypothetical protein
MHGATVKILNPKLKTNFRLHIILFYLTETALPLLNNATKFRTHSSERERGAFYTK